MDFLTYQNLAKTTAKYPNIGNNFVYPALGLSSEAGEVAGKIKKVLRDDNGVVSEEKKQAIKDELGDVLWYIAQLATELKLPLDEIAENNVLKLKSRLDRGVITGEGDKR